MAIAALAAPAAASANVYCVGTSGGDCTNPSPDFQNALDAADANPGDDTVRLGGGTFTGQQLLGFYYLNGNGKVSIIGAGQGQTTLTMPADPGDAFYINEVLHLDASGGGSSVSDLTVSLPAPSNNDLHSSQYRGVVLFGGQANRVSVNAPPTPINGYGIWAMSGGPVTIEDSNVALPLGLSEVGLINTSSEVRVEDSTISGNTGVLLRGPPAGTHEIKRTTIRGGIGVNIERGTLNLESTLVDLGSFNGDGIRSTGNTGFAETATLNLDHATIATTNPSSEGVRLVTNDATAADTRTATLRNSVISGPAIPILRQADNGDTANVNTDYSNYDAAANFSSNGTTGTGAIAETNQTNLPPGFVNPAAGNYHLAPSSPLIDIGDPTPPATGALDLDGDPRGLDGIGPCVPMAPGSRDIGADEYDCVPPETTITGGPTGLISDNTPSFTFSSEPGASFECRFDSQAFAPCSGPGATHTPAPLADGAHQFEVRALDLNANPDPTPASQGFSLDAPEPETTIDGKRKVKTRKKRARVKLTLGSSEPAAGFECSVDDGPFKPCSSPFTTRLRRGRHTVTARAKDALGNIDDSPASHRVRVKRIKRS